MLWFSGPSVAFCSHGPYGARERRTSRNVSVIWWSDQGEVTSTSTEQASSVMSERPKKAFKEPVTGPVSVSGCRPPPCPVISGWRFSNHHEIEDLGSRLSAESLRRHIKLVYTNLNLPIPLIGTRLATRTVWGKLFVEMKPAAIVHFLGRKVCGRRHG